MKPDSTVQDLIVPSMSVGVAEEKVIHWGLLGFQHQQRLVIRLSILFKELC